MPTTCVWTDGVATTVTKKFLCRQFGRFGHVSHCVIDSERGRALIYYDSMELAQQAVNEMRGRALAGKKIQVLQNGLKRPNGYGFLPLCIQ